MLNKLLNNLKQVLDGVTARLGGDRSLENVTRSSDLVLAFVIVCIIAMLIIPIPPDILDIMIACNTAAAQCGKSNGARRTRARDAITATLAVFGQINTTALSGSLAQQQRRARWRVHLHAVMHFHNFNVPIRPKGSGGLTDQTRQQGDAE